MDTDGLEPGVDPRFAALLLPAERVDRYPRQKVDYRGADERLIQWLCALSGLNS